MTVCVAGEAVKVEAVIAMAKEEGKGEEEAAVMATTMAEE